MGGTEGYFSPSVSFCLCVRRAVCVCMPFGFLQGRGRKREMSGRKNELRIERSTEIKKNKC